MTLEIRPIKPEELEEFRRIDRMVFAAGPDMSVNMPSDWTLCAFEDGKMTTSYGFYPLTILLNGAEVPISGVTMVGTLPVYRRRGYLRKITTRHFEMLYEQGERHIAALFASGTAIYQRYGYGVVSGSNAYTIEPRDVQLLHTPPLAGEFREAGEAENDLLLDIYHQYAAGKNGYLLRKGDYLTISGAPYTTYQPPELAEKLVKVVYYEDDKPLGYLAYTVTRDMRPGKRMGQALSINDMAWLAPSAYHAIWTYLSRFDLVNQISFWRAPPDDPLPHSLLEPKRLEVTVPSNGLLARLINVGKALPLRPYAAEGRLTFDIVDDLCQWNRGTWQLEASGTGSAVSRANGNPQVTMPVSTLAMLIFGRITATQAARMGRMDVHDATALPLWDSVMKTDYAPFCADMF
ncbi:MAG: GNAT family N-acetyltransferase [Dehalococcoidales bacterium]|nr:GNAT family N-acetyltransferase [Dehalococcoidales bacterium]